jgi:hypothetical protein
MRLALEAGCQSAIDADAVLVRLVAQSGPERGCQEAPREVEMSATASGPPRLMGRAAELQILSELLDCVAERGAP